MGDPGVPQETSTALPSTHMRTLQSTRFIAEGNRVTEAL
jgi:hypothetical protein